MLARMWSKENTSHIAGGNANSHNHSRNQVLQDPTLQPLGIYPKDTPSYHKHICLTTFIATLLMIV